ncbi:MAG: hypothetical protein JXQ85_12185 [Cognatishimia sp.]|uniref:hypothetical protein n=1 Tax=Cognatishimia sp. TaxID=2211648 RepID=UPI003B8E30A4
MLKLLLFPVLMLFACALAALYGAVHNQISFSVSPGYFYELKFIQFRIDEALQNRIGAAWVGVQASWWMGLIIGFPIYIVSLFVKGTKPFVRAFMRVSIMVVVLTLGIGLGALAFAEFNFVAGDLPEWAPARNVSDPLAFAKAGFMHDFSYMGGFIGLIFGVFLTIKYARQSRREV